MLRVNAVFIGDADVGKTSCLVSYKNNEFPGENIPKVYTPTIENINIYVDGRPINLCLWDCVTSSDFRYRTYPHADVVIAAFSINSRQSYENIMIKWFPEKRLRCPGVPFVLVGTKCDLRDREISREEAENLASDRGFVKYLECSALTQEGLKELFEESVRSVLKHRKMMKDMKKCGCSLM